MTIIDVMTSESEINPSYSPVSLKGVSTNNTNDNHNSTNPITTSQNGFNWTAGTIALSIFLFIVAAIFEIGGGYLVWIGLRNKNKPYLFIPIGSIILILYGIMLTKYPFYHFNVNII